MIFLNIYDVTLQIFYAFEIQNLSLNNKIGAVIFLKDFIAQSALFFSNYQVNYCKTLQSIIGACRRVTF